MSENGKLPPDELAPIAEGELRKDCAAAWNAMNQEARSLGLELVPTGSKSSYRTYEQQQELYALYLSGEGALAAVPGNSNHGLGTAVDTPTTEMHEMIARIGAKYGYDKRWSDAPSEPWHVVYQPGHYSGSDPGPYGVKESEPVLAGGEGGPVVRNADGRLEVFAHAGDTVAHRWQEKAGQGWVPGWVNLGQP